MAYYLKRTLVFGNGVSPVGLLRSCLEFAIQDEIRISGVFEAIDQKFAFEGNEEMLSSIEDVNDFRNQYVAHQEKELTDNNLAKKVMAHWISTIILLSKT